MTDEFRLDDSQIHHAKSHYAQGKDTAEIADILNVRESDVYNAIFGIGIRSGKCDIIVFKHRVNQSR